MNEEIREVLEENEAKRNKEKKDINPFDYVTIPLSEYKKLIKKVEKYKTEMESQRSQKYEYSRQLDALRDTLHQYKNDLRKKCGLDELEKVGDMNA